MRELGVYSEVVPYHSMPADYSDICGIILSGSPYSVYQPDAFTIDPNQIPNDLPVLGICYGAQLTMHLHGGKVEKAGTREYGKSALSIIKKKTYYYKTSPKRHKYGCPTAIALQSYHKQALKS